MIDARQLDGSRSRAVDLLDSIPTEGHAKGKAARLGREGKVRQAYEDVSRYMLYVESLTESEEHQRVRLKRAKWFMPHAAREIVTRGDDYER